LILLTVLVGIRGLYQDHTKDGKLTRAGRAVVAAMVFLGVLTFLSGMLTSRIADQKERAEAAEREERFKRQMSALRGVTGTLRGVSNSLSDLQGGMQNSLRAQRDLFGKADDNLRMTGELQSLQQANTLAVLRRVSPERVAISVSYKCPKTEELGAGPVEFESASISISGPGQQAARLSTGEKVNLSDGLVFHGFLGDLGPYEAFPAWRTARVTLRLAASRIGGFFTLSDLQRFEEVKQRTGREPQPPICPTTMMLFLNGRQVLSAAGELRALLPDDDAFSVEFTDLRVDHKRLPSYPR
jgi:hypothetical protein